MANEFEDFVNGELPKRISTPQDPLTVVAGRIPVTTGNGLSVELKPASEIAAAAGTFTAVTVIASGGTNLTLDVDVNKRVNAFDITLDQPNMVLNLLNAEVPEDYVWSISFTLRQKTGTNKVTWPANIVWAYNRAPALSYNQGGVDLITLVSDPVAKKWRGMLDGGWFNG